MQVIRIYTVFAILFLGTPLAFANEDPPIQEVEQSDSSEDISPSPGLLTLRAGVESTMMLAVGTIWYWLDRERNVADWDFESWHQRFVREAFRYDNNLFAINFALHPLSGSAMYGVSRINRMSVLASYAFAFLTSFSWEWLLEFRERVSINDQITTPTAGLAIGEFFVKLGRYLNSAPRGTPGQKALAWTLGFPVAIHRAMDGESTPLDVSVNEDGYAAPMWSRFYLSAGFSHVQAAKHSWLASIFLEGEFVEISRYRERGKTKGRIL